MRILLVTVIVGLLTGCVLPDGTGRTTGQARQAAQYGVDAAGSPAVASPWLNARASISDVVRTTTRSGIDVRQALYVVPGPIAGSPVRPHPQLLLRARDYSSRAADHPDPQMVILLDPLVGTSQVLELPMDALPVKLSTGAARASWVASTLALSDNGSLKRSGARMFHWLGGTSASELATGDVLAMGLLTDEVVVGRNIIDIKLAGGMPAVQLDWSSQARRYSLIANEWQTLEQFGFTTAPRAMRTAGYRINHEPALPNQSRIEYLVSSMLAGGSDTRLLAGFPYHVTNSPLAWEPPLAWLDDATLATITFLPDAAGPSPRANHQGLFRLVTINADTGTAALIEDHLNAGLPVVAGGGVVFYTRLQASGDGRSWELWAAAGNGLSKQRLASFDAGTTVLSVEDLLDGRRLLVHRQYLVTKEEGPQLISELREYSLDLLENAPASTSLEVEPLVPFEQSADDPLERFVPRSTGDGPPPIHVPE